jgi:hypothetical protein
VRFGTEIVAVERYVEVPDRHLDAGELGDVLSEPAGEKDAAGGNSDNDHSRRIGIVQSGLLDDLMRYARYGPSDISVVE